MNKDILSWYSREFQSLDHIARPNAEAVKAVLDTCILWLPSNSYKTIVDVGAGSGLIAQALSYVYFTVIALDLTYDEFTNAKGYRGLQTYTQIKGDAHYLRNYFQPESIDGLVVNHSFEHLYSPMIFLAEAFCVLRKGGRIFLNLPHQSGPVGRMSIHHPSVLRLVDFYAIFKELGFKVIHAEQLCEIYLDYWFILQRKSLDKVDPKIRTVLEKRMRNE